MNIDQEFKSLIPALTDEEYKQLEENIIKEGCRDALVIWNGTLIDGHNRYKICTMNNVPFKTVSREFETREKVIEWIVKNQLGRRNMSDYSKGILAFKLEEVLSEKVKDKEFERKTTLPKSTKSNSEKFNTMNELAKIAGIGQNNMKRIKVIEREASPEQKEELVKKTKSINKVFRELGHGLPKKKPLKEIEKKIIEDDNCEIEKPESKYEANKRINKCLAEVVKDLHDDNKVVIITSNDLVRDLQSFTDTFIRNANRSVSEYDVTITQENSKKITAILFEVEEAVKKIKGCFVNE